MGDKTVPIALALPEFTAEERDILLARLFDQLLRRTPMRIMAVDYGDAHTGIAVSDPTGLFPGIPA